MRAFLADDLFADRNAGAVDEATQLPEQRRVDRRRPSAFADTSHLT
jgi:hypothetical protein